MNIFKSMFGIGKIDKHIIILNFDNMIFVMFQFKLRADKYCVFYRGDEDFVCAISRKLILGSKT